MTGRYLVTGAAGFIGSKVAELLLESGAAVTGIDNMNDAYDVRLKQWRLAPAAGLGPIRVRQRGPDRRSRPGGALQPPIRRRAQSRRQSGRCASRSKDPGAYFQTNVMGTLNLLELCKERGIRKLVQASTSSVYGDSEKQPFTEDADSDRPLSPYAAVEEGGGSPMPFVPPSPWDVDHRAALLHRLRAGWADRI